MGALLEPILSVSFPHGLGDCVHFAHQLPLYTRRGYRIEVVCSPDKQILFAPCQVKVTSNSDGAVHVPWQEGLLPGPEALWNNVWKWSKAARNLSVAPLPDIGSPQDLWDEYSRQRLNIWPYLPSEAHREVREWLQTVTRPVILLHTHGNTSQNRKNLDAGHCESLYRSLLRETGGTLVLLDWDDRVPRLAHSRVRHLTDDWKRIDTARLLALIGRAELMIGVDSGPLHATRFFQTPAIGVWMRNGAPSTWALPRAEQINVVVGKGDDTWRRHHRAAFHIVECSETDRMVEVVTKLALYMITGPRYLASAQIGADALLQWFVRECMHGGASALGGYSDRDRSFDILLRVMSGRFTGSRVVETGCIRSEDDFAGAGFSTYILGHYLANRGGRLIAVDNDAGHCAFARTWTQCFGTAVEVVQSDSVGWLRQHNEPIDVLYLDSLDTESEGAAAHGLAEIQAAYPHLHAASLVAFDDTVFRAGQYHGKGALGVPWLLDQGWELIYSGHQTVVATRAFLRNS
jgi:hypothetical protein